MSEVKELASIPGCRIGSFGNIIIMVMRWLSPQALDLLEQHEAELIKEHGKVVSMTIITGDKLVPPPAGLRDRSTNLYNRFEPQLVCSAVVINARGFAAVIARTFMAAWQLVLTQKKPQQTFREISKAVDWVNAESPSTRAYAGAAQAIEAFAAKP